MLNEVFYCLCKNQSTKCGFFITACCLSSLVPFSVPNSLCKSGQCISAEENVKKNCGSPNSCYNGFQIFPHLKPVSIRASNICNITRYLGNKCIAVITCCHFTQFINCQVSFTWILLKKHSTLLQGSFSLYHIKCPITKPRMTGKSENPFAINPLGKLNKML